MSTEPTINIPTGPIDAPPFGAIRHPDSARGSSDQGRTHDAVLTDALKGIELGSWDHAILAWLAGWEPSTVATVASWLLRARQAGRDETAGGAR